MKYSVQLTQNLISCFISNDVEEPDFSPSVSTAFQYLNVGKRYTHAMFGHMEYWHPLFL